jgi:tetratricopeptide (TPR) repeat protein
MYRHRATRYVLVPLFTALIVLNTAAQQIQFETRTSSTVAAWELRVPPKAAQEMVRGNEATSRGEWSKAIACFQAAIAAYPEYAVAYNNLGNIYVKIGEYDKAIAAFERAIRLSDHLSMAYVNEARLLHTQGRSADAEPLLKKVLSYDPRYGDALLLLSFVDCRQRKYDEALSFARNALAIDAAQYALAHVAIGIALQAKSDFDAAAAEYRAFLKQAPQSPYAARARARLEQLQASK